MWRRGRDEIKHKFDEVKALAREEAGEVVTSLEGQLARLDETLDEAAEELAGEAQEAVSAIKRLLFGDASHGEEHSACARIRLARDHVS